MIRLEHARLLARRPRRWPATLGYAPLWWRSCWPRTPSACTRPVRGGRCGSGRGGLRGRCWRPIPAGPNRPPRTPERSGGSGTTPTPPTARASSGWSPRCRRPLPATPPSTPSPANGRPRLRQQPGQLRFDAAHHLLTGAEQHPRSGGGLVGQVTIPLSSLVGVDDAPGELAGVGPIRPVWPAS